MQQQQKQANFDQNFQLGYFRSESKIDRIWEQWD